MVASRRIALQKLERVACKVLWPVGIPLYTQNPSDLSTWQYAQKLAVFAGWLEYVKVTFCSQPTDV